MKYDLEDTKSSPAVETLSSIQMAELQEDFKNAYENLCDSVKQLDAVHDIMENIETSQRMLATYGSAAIPQLNIDKGLEALCKIPENMITVDKAVEGLGDAARDMWEKFRAWIKQIWLALKQLFKAIIGQNAQIIKEVEKVVEVIKKEPVVVEKIVTKEVSNGVAEEEARAWEALANEANAKLQASQEKVKELQTVVDALKSVKVEVQFDQSKLDAISSKLDSQNASVTAKLEAMLDAITDPAVKSQLEAIVKKLGTLDQHFSESNNKLKELTEQTKAVSQKVDSSRDSTLQNLGWTADKMNQHAEQIKKMITDMPKVQSLSDLVMNDVDRAAAKLGEEWNAVKSQAQAVASAAQDQAKKATATTVQAGIKVKEETIRAAQKVEAKATAVAHRASAAVVMAANKTARPFRIAAAIANAMGAAAKAEYQKQTAQ